MKKKRLTSWQKRKRRRIRIVVSVSASLILLISVGVFLFARKSYGTIVLSDLYDISYSGCNNNGKIVLEKKDMELQSFLSNVKNSYEKSIIKKSNVTDEDYARFASSISASASQNDKLSNGSQLVIDYGYDEELAEKLNIKVLDSESNATVGGLKNAAVLTKDSLFKDLEVTFDGISPNITMEIVNKSTNPFIQNVAFMAENYQETYSIGDIVSVRAYFSDEQSDSFPYIVDTPSAECTKEYEVTGGSEYVNSSDDLPSYIVDEAISQAKLAFTDANEYGVRIFCEANLVPVYIDKKATFRWLNPSLLSVYFKSANPGVGGVNGNNYNDLDVVFKCKITQADGVTCEAEEVIRFSNIIKNEDGSYEYDFSNPRMISASYSDYAIKQVVVGKYADTYKIEKLSL